MSSSQKIAVGGSGDSRSVSAARVAAPKLMSLRVWGMAAGVGRGGGVDAGVVQPRVPPRLAVVERAALERGGDPPDAAVAEAEQVRHHLVGAVGAVEAHRGMAGRLVLHKHDLLAAHAAAALGRVDAEDEEAVDGAAAEGLV